MQPFGFSGFLQPSRKRKREPTADEILESYKANALRAAAGGGEREVEVLPPQTPTSSSLASHIFPSLTPIPSLSTPTTIPSSNLVNPNLVVQTQVSAMAMKNPLDLSEVTDITDRRRLERVDHLFCSLSDDMPLLTKHKVKSILNTHYRFHYDWDDSVFVLPVFLLVERFRGLEYIKHIGIGKQGIIFQVWKQTEMEKQEIEPTNKRRRVDTTDNGNTLMSQ